MSVQETRGWSGARVEVGMLRGRENPLLENENGLGFLGFLVSWFLGFWFLGFRDSLFPGFLVSWCQRFLVSWFQFFGFEISKIQGTHITK